MPQLIIWLRRKFTWMNSLLVCRDIENKGKPGIAVMQLKIRDYQVLVSGEGIYHHQLRNDCFVLVSQGNRNTSPWENPTFSLDEGLNRILFLTLTLWDKYLNNKSLYSWSCYITALKNTLNLLILTSCSMNYAQYAPCTMLIVLCVFSSTPLR